MTDQEQIPGGFGKKLDPEEEYKRVMGEDAYERQKELGKQFYSCCGQNKAGGHSLYCLSHPLRKK